MINYSIFTDFFILIIGISIMILLRSIKYTNKKINIHTPIFTDFSNKSNIQLMIPKKEFSYTLSELFQINDLNYSKFSTILLKNKEVAFYGKHISLESKCIRNSTLNILKSNLFIVSGNENNEIFKKKDSTSLFYIDKKPFLLIENNTILLSKSINFDSSGSLLLWNLLFEEPKFITI